MSEVNNIKKSLGNWRLLEVIEHSLTDEFQTAHQIACNCHIKNKSGRFDSQRVAQLLVRSLKGRVEIGKIRTRSIHGGHKFINGYRRNKK